MQNHVGIIQKRHILIQNLTNYMVIYLVFSVRYEVALSPKPSSRDVAECEPRNVLLASMEFAWLESESMPPKMRTHLRKAG